MSDNKDIPAKNDYQQRVDACNAELVKLMAKYELRLSAQAAVVVNGATLVVPAVIDLLDARQT